MTENEELNDELEMNDLEEDYSDHELMSHKKVELVEMVVLQQSTIDSLKLQLSQAQKEHAGEGFLVFTPEPPSPDMPRYTGKTGGMFFRNGIAFVKEEDLIGFPPAGDKVPAETKLTMFCKDFGYTFRKGSSDEALKLMGGMDVVMLEPTMPGRG